MQARDLVPYYSKSFILKISPCGKYIPFLVRWHIVMKILIVGGSGFLGHHTANLLISEGHEVTVMVPDTSKTELLDANKIRLVSGDVTDARQLEKLIIGYDAVVNMAGIVSYWRKQNDLMFKVNHQGAKNVALACLKNKIKKLIHISSTVTIGYNEDHTPADENTVYNLAKLNVAYCDSKYFGEQEVLKAVTLGLDATILCPASMHGDGDIRRITTDSLFKFSFPYNVFYPQNGQSVVDVKDVALAISLAIKKGKKGQRYIICSENISYYHLKKIIAQEIGAQAPFLPLPEFILWIMTAANDLLKRATGTRPKMTLDMVKFHGIKFYFNNKKSIEELGLVYTPIREAIRRGVKWYKENGYLK